MNYKLSYLLAENSSFFNLKEVEEITRLNKEVIVHGLNKWITEMDADSITIKKISTEEWVESYLNFESTMVEFDSDARVKLLYLMTYSKFENLSVFHFQEFLDKSKGTISGDIKRLRNYLNKADIQFIYDRKEGFYLSGNEFEIRRLAKNFLSELFEDKQSKYALLLWISNLSIDQYAEMRDKIELVLKQGNVNIVYSRLDEFIYYLILSHKRIDSTVLDIIPNQLFLKELELYPTAIAIIEKIKGSKVTNQNEPSFFLTVLMTIVQGELEDKQLEFILQDSAKLIKCFESLSAIHFDNYRQLLMNVFYHLVPLYFRIYYGYHLSNPLMEDIKLKYGDIFELTQDAMNELVSNNLKSVRDEEIGYLTILFGGEIYKKDKHIRQDSLTALVVCPSGVSSSMILQSELEAMFPTINFLRALSIPEVDSVDSSKYDIVFSTVPIESKRKVYISKPIMNAYEKNVLINQVQEDWLLPGVSLPRSEEILSVIRPYIDFKKGVTYDRLIEILDKKLNQIFDRNGDEKPLLKDLVTSDMIILEDEVDDWREGIQLSAQPLQETGKIESSYIDAMIRKVEENGPFINIGENVALPHSRPEEGVNDIGISILKLNKPVNLLEDESHPIKLFICLAAIDNETHLKALANLTTILSNEQLLDRLVNANSKEDILQVIREGEE